MAILRFQVSYLLFAGIALLQVGHHYARPDVFGASPIPTSPEKAQKEAVAQAGKIQHQAQQAAAGLPSQQLMPNLEQAVPGNGGGGGLSSMPGRFFGTAAAIPKAGVQAIPVATGMGRKTTMGTLNALDYGSKSFADTMTNGGGQIIDTMGTPFQGTPIGGAFLMTRNGHDSLNGFGEKLRSNTFDMSRQGFDKGFGTIGAHDDGITQQGYSPAAKASPQQQQQQFLQQVQQQLDPTQYLQQGAQIPSTIMQQTGNMAQLPGHMMGNMNQLNPFNGIA